MRHLEELISIAEPAWPSVLQWAQEATNSVEIGERARRPVPIAELWSLQLDIRAQLIQAG